MSRRVLFTLIISLLLCERVTAQVLPTGFVRTLVVNGLSNPTAFAFAPDGRIFVCQQTGELRVIKNGSLLATPFASLTVNSTDERGLLGIAFDPQFTTNQYIYLYYTVATPPVHNRVSRFTAGGDVVVPGSEVILLDLDPLTAFNHNGGALAFGLDGKLYVAAGENAVPANSQNLDNYLGKLLRINPDGSVPAGNPFTTGSEPRKRIWAFGLRNPYTFAIDPGTGRLFINDVGQSTWEEVNDATTGGLNFGWVHEEGPGPNTTYIDPFYYYGRGSADGLGCAITGGTFFRPSTTNYPSSYYGMYFFLDLCSSWINFIDPTLASPARSPFATSIGGSPVGLSTGNDGNLYYLSRADNALYKIVYNLISPPFITQQPAPVSIDEAEPLSLSISTIGSLPQTYQWKRNDVDILNGTAQTFSIAEAQPSDAGNYKVTITNAGGSATSVEVVVTVTDLPGTVVGIENPDGGLRVYPNPASGYFNLELSSGTVQVLPVYMSDVLAREIKVQNFNMDMGINRLQVDIANLPFGLYVIRFELDGRKHQHKLLVK